MRYKLTIAYDGTQYAGWQVQTNGPTIQAHIQNALQKALRHPVDLSGAGRTDAGVHARGQTAHFDTTSQFDLRRLLRSLNALLPTDIRVMEIEPTSSDFHARYSAIGKEYHYHIHLDPVLNPFSRLYRYHLLGPCNIDLIHVGATHFLGTHDFLSFANERGKPTKDSIRTIKRLEIVKEKGGIRMEFEGDGFLYKMVRNITGTLLDIGSGKIDPKEIPSILSARDRKRAGRSAPAHGLFLMKVIYSGLK